MPIYDFHCSTCGNKFEQLVKLNESPPCPACSSAETTRQFSFSAGISTGKTQGRALNEAKQIRKTRVAERHERELNSYLKDHHEDHH